MLKLDSEIKLVEDPFLPLYAIIDARQADIRAEAEG